MGLIFEEITASSLVKISIDGEVAPGQAFKISMGNWYPMKAVHAARPEAEWVLHTHDVYGQALSARQELLQPVSQGAAFLLADSLAYHHYDGVETVEARIPSVQKSLGDANRMILHNHGLLTIGRTAYEALSRMAQLSKACHVQLLAGRSGDLIHISGEVMKTMIADATRPGVNDNPWPGLLRKLDRLDPSYKE